jgi:regulator of sirC expression with transglutaminase-like and TPR domain
MDHPEQEPVNDSTSDFIKLEQMLEREAAQYHKHVARMMSDAEIEEFFAFINRVLAAPFKAMEGSSSKQTIEQKFL